MTTETLELTPVESNQNIETKYKEELLTLFSSGIFLFNTKGAKSEDNTSPNPVKLYNALIDYYSNDKLKKCTKTIYDRVSSYHKDEFDSQLNSINNNQIYPINKIENSQNYHDYTEKLQYLNYTVIKNLRDDFIYNIMLPIQLQGLFNAPKQVENQIISNAVNKINQRIEIISSDQVIKITHGLTMAKCMALGLNEYQWQTMEDDLVRPTHAANNQKIFTWDNPPHETGHPGTEVNCRCKPKIIVPRQMANLLDLEY